MTDQLEQGRPAEVLLVEDNESDVVLTREGFKQARLAVNLHHVEQGEQCMSFLRKEGEFTDAPTPDLILLDLNMPVMDGREVMEELAKDKSLSHLPVVVLTTSDEERDILNMYKLRCSSYVTKPVDFGKFATAIRELTNYWFTLVVLPNNEH